MLLSEDIYHIPGLLPAVGRLANAMVAALGPDYVLGSAAYDACRSVVAELRAPDASGVRRPEDSLASALESVLYAQMLVLFAPRALPAAQHVAVLVATLPSRQPQLRKAASDTLRHLAERDVHAVLAQRIEPALAQCFSVFGLERDLARDLVASNPHFIDIHAKCLGQANGLAVAVGKNFGGSEHGSLPEMYIWKRTYFIIG